VLTSGRVDEGQDVGVLQLCGDPDLAQEPLGAEGRGQFGVQDLEGDGTIVPDVVRQEDRGHPAATELALDRVGGGECFGEPRSEVGQAGPLGKGGRAVGARERGDPGIQARICRGVPSM
jgi:hypothetical protein